MSNFVLPKFYGRLGNQFFQVAAAIGYAKKYGTDWLIPRNYHHRDIYHWFPKNSNKLFKGDVRKLHVYDRTLSDATWVYDEIPFYSSPVEIRGFFQSCKFFDHAAAEVKQVFTLPINPIDYCSLHVRRGDYLDKNQQTFCPVDMNYIRQAMQKMKDFGKTKFMVVSDDLPWCRENIKDSDCEIRFSDGKSVMSDLSLMASCTDHIISNSTLAWWAAWLGHSDSKIVVSPHHEAPNWFLHNRMDTTHLIPTEWHQIKYR
jgi:hypothetical protein